MKQCKWCGETLPLTAFKLRKGGGRQQICRRCVKKYRQSSPAHVRRTARLKHLVQTGQYVLPPAETIAYYILYGQVRYGEQLIDDDGKRIDLGY